MLCVHPRRIRPASEEYLRQCGGFGAGIAARMLQVSVPRAPLPLDVADSRCGNLGHIAENCQSPSRVCYNCREVGHESTNCPHPRTTDGKQCYACGGVGHVKSDCPSLRGVIGAPPGAGFPRGGMPGVGPNSPAVRFCYQCGRGGHLARNCPARARRAARANPTGAPVKCFRCNGENHLARDCLAPAPRDDATKNAAKKCYKCSETGHIARECPTLAQAAPATTATTAKTPGADPSPVSPAAAGAVGDAVPLPSSDLQDAE